MGRCTALVKLKTDFNNNPSIYLDKITHQTGIQHLKNFSHTKTICPLKDTNCSYYDLNVDQVKVLRSKDAKFTPPYNVCHTAFYFKHPPSQAQASSLGITLTTQLTTTPLLTATPQLTATPTIAIATPTVVKPKPKPKLDYTKIQTYCIEEMRTTYKTNILITNLKALQTGLKTGLQTLPNLLLKGGNIHTKKQTKSNQYKQTKSKQYKQTKNKQYKQYKQYKTKINNINTSGRPDQLTYKKLSTIKNITRKANNKNAFS